MTRFRVTIPLVVELDAEAYTRANGPDTRQPLPTIRSTVRVDVRR